MKLWKKVLAAVTAGMLCLGCAGVSGLQGVLGSVSAVLPVCAAENDTAYTAVSYTHLLSMVSKLSSP